MPPAPPSPLALVEVSRRYRVRARAFARAEPLLALDAVSLELSEGEVLAVIGESGAGKSTLARIAAGLEAPDAGEVRLFGAPPPAPRARARLVQLVFQEAGSALDPRLSVRACIEEPLVVQGEPTSGAADRLASEVGLDADLLDRFPGTLSGGQKSRVGLARALALSPRALVLDEPLAALDTSAAAQVLTLLSDLRAGRGLCMLWVTHDVAAARAFADRVAVLADGRIVEAGSVALLDAPEHPETRALVEAAQASRGGRAFVGGSI